MINKKILEDKNYTRNILEKEELLNQVDELYIKTVLNSKNDQWGEIKEELTSKINSGEIKSSYDLQFVFGNLIPSNFYTNILNAQVEAMFNFKELEFSHAEKLLIILKKQMKGLVYMK